MAEISKQALKVENNTSFPNNNTGAITPSDLRAFNVDMIDSLVDELGYNVDSASWNQSIDALEAFTSSQQPSFNALNQFTASQLVINSGVNAFTQSADARLDALESETQNLELFTASVNQIADNGIVQGTSTRLHFYGLVSASIVPNVNGAIASINIEQDGTKLNSASFNSYTASTDSDLDSIHQTTQSLNNFTASLTTAFVGTASFNAYTQSINSYTSSNDAKVNSLINATASYATSAITASSLVTASVNLNTITFTKGDASTFNITVNTGSGGGGTTDITSLNAFTASQDTKNTTLANVTASLNASTASQQSQIDNLIAATGSYITTPLTSLNQFTQSQDTKNSTLATYTASVDTKFSTLGTQSGSWITESETASFARTNVDNNFTANQTFTNITAVSASFTYVQTTYETSSVIYSSGSNQFGDAADDVQTLYGSVRVVNELTASGLNYPNADNGAKAFMQTDGAGNLSLQYVDAIFETVRNMSGIALDKGTPVYISGSTGDNGNAYVADASDTAKMPAVYILGEDLAIGATGIALVGGLIEGVDTTGYPAGTIIYVAEGGGWSDVRPSGSASIVQVLGVVQKEGVGGQGVVINQLEATLPNIQTGYAWVGNGSNQPVQVATSSFIDAIPLTSLNSFTQSQDTKNTTLENVTSSLQSYTASQASLNATFATTGSNSFDGNQIISGGLTLSGSFGITYVEGGAEVIQQVTALGNYQTLYDGGLLFQTDGVNNYEQTIPTTFSKGVTINSGSAFNDGVTITGGLTGSLQQGYAWVGNVAGVSVPVPTSSFAGGGGQTFANPSIESISGSVVLSALTFTSGAANLLHLTASAQNQANLVFKNNNNTGNTILSGSNNIFTNPNTPTTGYIKYVGGTNNLYLNSFNGINSEITASAVSISGNRPTMNNNIFQGASALTINQAVNGGAHVYSSNLFGAANAMTINALAYTGSAFTVNDNIFKGGVVTINPASASLAEIATGVSGSGGNGVEVQRNLTMGAAGMNISVGPQVRTGFNSIVGNIITGGQLTVTNISSSTSVAAANNNVNQAQTYTNAGAANLGIHRQVGIMSNNFGGMNLIASASAIAATANISTQALTVTNRMYSGSVIGSGSLIYSNNINAGGANTYTITGSFGGTGFLGMSNNAVIGGSNTIFTNVEGRGNHVGFLSNVIGGQNLILTGSNSNAITASGGGYFGRFNADDGIRNQSAENIFFVGTGTSVSNRKTGFLIDSGSNTFVEGTFNVSGSTSLNGDLNITGSLTASLQEGYVWVGNASGITTTVATSSFGGGGAAFPFTGNAVITGSLGISGSMFGGVIDLIVATATASVDFSAANMFTLTLPSASTHINPTNIRAGQTVNIQITQPTPGTGSVTFPSNVKFAGGNDYQATTTGSAIDMLTLVSYDGTNVLATSIKNFL